MAEGLARLTAKQDTLAQRTRRLYRRGVQSVPQLAFCAALWTVCAASIARADEPSDGWIAPFGGRFNAYFTIASDYAANGISSTELGPAFQASLDYRTPNLLPTGSPPLWLYGSVLGSNVSFPGVGAGTEIDLSGGLKMRLLGDKLSLSLGYIRYLYPGIAASFGWEYGEIELRADYDFGPALVSGRVRYSANGQGGVGRSWNKRALVSAPVSFAKLPFDARLRVYGSFGDVWGEKPEAVGLPTHDYLYWQLGLVTSVWGLDFTLAYTDTDISPSGCGNTQTCAGRVFVSVTKVF